MNGEPVFWWQQFDLPVGFWWLVIVVVFVAWLCGLAAIFESRPGREWLRRLQTMQRARQQQADELEPPSWQDALETRRLALENALPPAERLPQK